MTVKKSDEPFLDRWSRLKGEARKEPPQAPRESQDAQAAKDVKAPPELPPVEQLTPESDFRPFLDSRVDEDTRRAALKKLFADARFNVIDEMDVYIDDYTKADPIPPAMLAALKQAQNILEWAKGDKKQENETALDSAKPDAAATTPSAALEQQVSSVTPSVAPGGQAAESVPAAPDPAQRDRSSQNP